MQIALFQPDIAQNTGTILRLCACLGMAAHIIEPAGFPFSDRLFRRAGMDYLDHVSVTRHDSWSKFAAWRAENGYRLLLFTTKGATPYLDFRYKSSDILLFGRESAGVTDEVAAAADARLVPASFVRNAEFSTSNQNRENRIFNMTVPNRFISVAPPYQNLTVNGAPDPRVRVQNMNVLGQDGATPFWRQLKYTAANSPMPIASYAEAQLILAEASTDQTEKLAALNRVRALSSIAPLTGTVTDDIIIEERRRQLYSEGQRYVDMLRKKLPFQSGTNRKGQTYSDLTCIPLPDVETLNNPNFSIGN